MKAQLYAFARREARALLNRGEVNITQLAENIAHHFEHDEWLDDEYHEVWGIASEVGEETEKNFEKELII
ncbi:MAG: hypothetical protein DWQ49_09405 [Bacteroidetes bacterium]|nr:MAG: hypothetical protein DWQ49_09405 [Bacteroidota bacterium]